MTIFVSSLQQSISNKTIFALARNLADKLKQESVAVFIPSEKFSIGDITLQFTSSQPTVMQLIDLIKEKLPPSYSQAFSLHLQRQYADFDAVKITAIEWLGQQVDVDLIKQVFPQETIISRHGQAYLVYRDGTRQKI